MAMKEHSPTGMPKGSSKGANIASPAHSDVTGKKSAGSKMNAKGIRAGGSKR
jgi:hypothetical protein